MVEPIFVLGWGRSGTTWLSNLLIEHPAIAGIQHEKHWGIHESAFFSVVAGRYGSLDDPANFIEFAQVMAASDYFRLAGADVNFLYSLYPTSYAEVFRQVMQNYATRSEAIYWLEKTPAHTLHAESIARSYPDARFIAIVRNVYAVVTSRMHGFERRTKAERKILNKIRRWFWIMMWVMVWQHYKNKIKTFAKRHPERTFVLTYEELAKDTESVMQQVCKFLNLKFNPSMLRSRYPANSGLSRKPPGTRDKILTPQERCWVKGWQAAASLIPAKVLSFAYELGLYLYNLHTPEARNLPRWFFRLLPNTSESLSRELSDPHQRNEK